MTPRGFLRLRPLLSLLVLLHLVPRGYCDAILTNDLSGTWEFAPAGAAKTTILVPGGGWKKQGFASAEADYEKTISIPSIGQPQVTLLKFGAINYQADLHVDGHFIESTTQSHTPATFDITDHVTPGSNHVIRVHVKGRDALLFNGRAIVPDGAGSWSTTLPDGIFRSAELLVYPQIYIEDVFVRTYVTNASLYYDVWIRNASASPNTVTVSGTLSSWNGDPWSYPALPSQPLNLPSNSVTKVTFGPVNWGLGPKSYWWPNVPYQSGYTSQLHKLHLAISGGGSHQTTVRFGFRECRQGPDGLGNTCYFLNGIRVNFRGDSLQGANYDGIDNGGQGNAYDTLPGFLPGTNGWPKAVDNYQRLNYNVVRIHQIPASPYMLDVCDEMGLMIIDETAIRGAGAAQDFVAGFSNMVNHVRQLFTRDRNHACVIRLSQSNEPDWGFNDSEAFQQALYDAAMEVDGTRPISIDAAWYDFHPSSPYGGVDDGDADNFNAILHYGEGNNKYGQYTEEVFERTDRPYGSGEHIWDADNTRQGFAWFATSTQAMRAKGASDVRPYTLLSAWASVIPGVATNEMRLENPPWNPAPLYPLHGENNLPNPWINAQLQRVQAAFNPVLVADRNYWELNKLSNATGEWPAYIPKLVSSALVTRQLAIYNDAFGDTAVDVFWELRQGSATGQILDNGTFNATVPLGYVLEQDIAFTTPNAPDGTVVYLVLYAEKGGVELFRETEQRFVLDSAVPIALINPGFEQPDVGKVSNGFDAAGPNDIPGWNNYGTMSDSGIEHPGFVARTGDYAGFLKGRQMGEGGAYQMTGYTIQPGDVFTLGYWAKVDWQESDNRAHMTGALFWNVVNDPAYEMGFVVGDNLSWNEYSYHELTVAADDHPASIGQELGVHLVNSNWDWAAMDDVTLEVSNPSALDITPPEAPTGLAALADDGSVSLDWADNIEPDLAGYTVYRSITNGGSYTSIVSDLGSSTYTDNTVINGTVYYYVVTATDVSANDSAFSSQVSAVPSVAIAPEEYHIADLTIQGSTNLWVTVSNSVRGHLYRILATDSLTPPLWINVVVEHGTGSDLLFHIPIDAASTNRYFKLDVQRQ